MKLIAYGKQRTDFICSLQSPCGCLYWYSFADAKWQEREHWLKKRRQCKDDRTADYSTWKSLNLGISWSLFSFHEPFSPPVNTPQTAFTT